MSDPPSTDTARRVPGRVELPGGRVIEVRRVEPGDASGLTVLYDGLGSEDSYCRFFVGHRPPDSFIEKMTRVRERGGVGLVAVLIEGNRPGRIIAEASCELLENGDGELGITVDQEHRGWLGPYLLDVLIDEAKSRGLINLEAQVLVMNTRMLALLRRRGMVTIQQSSDPSTLRVAVGVARGTVVWPRGSSRARLLAEAPGLSWVPARTFENQGYDVIVCSGPAKGGPPCPLERGEPCPLASEADLIVISGELPDDLRISLLEGHEKLHPSLPVVVRSAADDTPLPSIEPRQRP